MDRANAGSKPKRQDCLRILTPLLKFRACRDNIPVATGAMEVRGGNGYIEEWVHAATGPRCPYRRALGRHQQHQRARYHHAARSANAAPTGRSRAILQKLLDEATADPGGFQRTACALRLSGRWLSPSASRPSRRWKRARGRRQARLYHVTSSILMIREAAQPEADARRALYARFVLEHRLSAQDPLEPSPGDWEREAAEIIFSERQVALAEIAGLLDRLEHDALELDRFCREREALTISCPGRSAAPHKRVHARLRHARKRVHARLRRAMGRYTAEPRHKIAKTTPCKVEWAPARSARAACVRGTRRKMVRRHGPNLISSRSIFLLEHDLFGKPVPTHRVVARGHAFPDRAAVNRCRAEPARSRDRPGAVRCASSSALRPCGRWRRREPGWC